MGLNYGMAAQLCNGCAALLLYLTFFIFYDIIYIESEREE